MLFRSFTPAQTRRVFEAARALGLPVKLHADQLSDLGGAALAAEFGGLSADHIEWTSDEAVRAMAAAGTVAADVARWLLAGTVARGGLVISACGCGGRADSLWLRALVLAEHFLQCFEHGHLFDWLRNERAPV